MMSGNQPRKYEYRTSLVLVALVMFMIGVMPFFFGFVFLGQCIFWKYSKFEDTSSSVITLFSLLNGDIVNDTFL